MFLLINNTMNEIGNLTKDMGYPISTFEYLVAQKDDEIHKTICYYIYKCENKEKTSTTPELIYNEAKKFIEGSANEFEGIIYVNNFGINESKYRLNKLFELFNENGKMVIIISHTTKEIEYSKTPLLIATTSKDKSKQIIFAIENMYPNKYKCYKLDDLGITHEVEEPFNTYQQNAMKKSFEYCMLTNMIAVSDDTGVEINEMNGQPGIHSARWGDISKQPAYLNVAEYMKKNELSSLCKMITCISVSIPGRTGIDTKYLKYDIQGFWCWNPKGEYGFAYDSYMMLTNGKTIAEHTMDDQWRNSLTPRMKSTNQMITYLDDILS